MALGVMMKTQRPDLFLENVFMLRDRGFILLALLVAALTGCAQGYCYGKKDGSGKPVSTIDTNKRVFVYREDGSKQCDAQSGESLESMGAKLGDIKIYSKEKKNDGKMHMTMCGAPTGKVNVYEIDEKDLPKAKMALFQEWRRTN
jgi:hypothetical protein